MAATERPAPKPDVVRVGDVWSLLVGDGPCRRSYEVTFSEPRQPVPGGAAGELIVHVNGTPVAVEQPAAFASRGRRTRGASAAPGAQAGNTGGPASVVAPMPGRVVKVLVKVGDTVAARQGLLVIEAMKMENELRAPRPGRVREIRPAQGALVEAGAVVVVLE